MVFFEGGVYIVVSEAEKMKKLKKKMFYHIIITNTSFNGHHTLSEYFHNRTTKLITHRYEVEGNNKHWHYLVQDKGDSLHNVHRFIKRWFGTNCRVSVKLIKSQKHFENVFKYIKSKPKEDCDLPRREGRWNNHRGGPGKLQEHEEVLSWGK